jgi:hypothetical protein
MGQNQFRDKDAPRCAFSALETLERGIQARLGAAKKADVSSKQLLVWKTKQESYHIAP